MKLSTFALIDALRLNRSLESLRIATRSSDIGLAMADALKHNSMLKFFELHACTVLY